MHFKNLTFNDLPTVVGELCKRIENLEKALIYDLTPNKS